MPGPVVVNLARALRRIVGAKVPDPPGLHRSRAVVCGLAGSLDYIGEPVLPTRKESRDLGRRPVAAWRRKRPRGDPGRHALRTIAERILGSGPPAASPRRTTADP